MSFARTLIAAIREVLNGRPASRTYKAIDIHCLPLERIQKVTFYKDDLITTDRIFCSVIMSGETFHHHEEQANWDRLIAHLTELPGFKKDWFPVVSQPPFAASETIAFSRDQPLPAM